MNTAMILCLSQSGHDYLLQVFISFFRMYVKETLNMILTPFKTSNIKNKQDLDRVKGLLIVHDRPYNLPHCVAPYPLAPETQLAPVVRIRRVFAQELLCLHLNNT